MMRYEEAVDWVYSTQLFGMKLGLESIADVLSALSVPLEGQRFVHVAGTNGKGSVCAMAESVLREAGYRTGLFTSPHLISYRERIVVDGEMVPEELVAAGLSHIRELVEDWDTHPTFFEITLALAMWVFAERGIEVGVLETGMGGRLDATNVIEPDVSVITPIALDHTQWLGETIEAIAAEKGGIIKPGVPVVCSPQLPAAAEVLERIAEERGAPLRWVEAAYAGEVGLAGEHQKLNAAVAIAALRAAPFEIPAESVGAGVASVRWRARFQRLGPRLVVDGAHNPAAAAATVETWRQTFGDRKATVVFGVVESKDVRGVLDLIGRIAGRWIFCEVNSVRGIPPGDLVTQVADRQIGAAVATGVGEALQLAEEDDLVLVCGSLFLAGEALSLLEGGEFETSAQ